MIPLRFCVFLVASLLLFSSGAFAASAVSGGFNSTGASDLPMGAGGVTFMWLKPSERVGIGVQNPQVGLDVKEGVKVGYTETCDSNRRGTIRYNTTNNYLEYCGTVGWIPVRGCYHDGGQYAFGNMGCASNSCYNNSVTGNQSCPAGYTSSYTSMGVPWICGPFSVCFESVTTVTCIPPTCPAGYE